MRSDAEIRREVETRLRRRGLFVLDAALWLFVGFALFEYSQYNNFSTTMSGVLIWLMLLWTLLLGLHFLRTVYVELRERLVRKAIERERQYYVLRGDAEYEKPKRDEAVYHLSDDGELVDFPADDHQAAYKPRAGQD